jgi:hypothetical protein
MQLHTPLIASTHPLSYATLHSLSYALVVKGAEDFVKLDKFSIYIFCFHKSMLENGFSPLSTLERKQE